VSLLRKCATLGLRQLQNIPRAESRHFQTLQNYAQQTYPSLKTGTLERDFMHPETQALYEQLVQEGKARPQAALNVGVKIEELDIRDLDEALANSPEATLRTIYKNLRAGSEKHLAAFSAKQGGGGQGSLQTGTSRSLLAPVSAIDLKIFTPLALRPAIISSIACGKSSTG